MFVAVPLENRRQAPLLLLLVGPKVALELRGAFNGQHIVFVFCFVLAHAFSCPLFFQ